MPVGECEWLELSSSLSPAGESQTFDDMVDIGGDAVFAPVHDCRREAGLLRLTVSHCLAGSADCLAGPACSLLVVAVAEAGGRRQGMEELGLRVARIEAQGPIEMQPCLA